MWSVSRLGCRGAGEGATGKALPPPLPAREGGREEAPPCDVERVSVRVGEKGRSLPLPGGHGEGSLISVAWGARDR